MVTVTLDEITLNAVKAALDERIARLERHALVLNIDEMLFVETEDHQRDVVWTNDAILQAKQAREYLSDPEVVPEHPADATYANYHDWQAAGPR